MLTGFNTDVEFDGVTYHVQTEDRVGSNPLIESLVYVRGEILATRRTGYRELLDAGAEVPALRALMEKQHFAIVEAVRRGRLQALAEPETSDESDTTVTRSAPLFHSPVDFARGDMLQRSQRSLDEVIGDWLAEQERSERVRLRVEGGEDLRFGASFRLRVSVHTSPNDVPVTEAQVVARFLSTETRPQPLASGTTGADGRVLLDGTLPEVAKGTGLVVVSVQHRGGGDEVKFLVRR